MESIDAVEIELSKDSPILKTSINRGPSLILESDKLDDIVGELAGNIVIRSEDTKGLDLWNNQKVLKGTSGNDKISIGNRQYANNDIIRKTEINATRGNDIYIGSAEIEKITYETVDEDNLTGLFLTNSEDEITIIGNNIAPLSLITYEQDDLIVFKEYEKTDRIIEIDRLKEIEIIRATNKSDRATIEGVTESTINFLKGHDKVVIRSENLMPAINKLHNMEEVKWIKEIKSEEGIMIDNGANHYNFNVIQVEEDITSTVYINDSLNELGGEAEDFELKSFDGIKENNNSLSEWVSLNKYPELQSKRSRKDSNI